MSGDKKALILYGPPAAGKSTITRKLHEADSRFVLFPRLKAGNGRAAEYRVTTDENIAALEPAGELIWMNRRYGSTYATDRTYLLAMLQAGLIPVLHAGQPEAVDAIIRALPDSEVTCVSLTCSREVARKRIAERANGDDCERLIAFDDTKPYANSDMVIDTGTSSAEEISKFILQRVNS